MFSSSSCNQYSHRTAPFRADNSHDKRSASERRSDFSTEPAWLIAIRENHRYSLCVSCAHENNRQLQGQVPALGRECPGHSGRPAVEASAFPQPEISSHAEMNIWKQSVLRQLAESAPAHDYQVVLPGGRFIASLSQFDGLSKWPAQIAFFATLFLPYADDLSVSAA